MNVFRLNELVDSMAPKENTKATRLLKIGVKIAGGSFLLGALFYASGWETPGHIGENLTAFGFLLFIILFTMLGIYDLSKQPGSSLKKVLFRIFIFFAICFTITAIVVLLGYIFHAPGINP